MSTENDEQKTFWERFADVWVRQQDDLDRLMAPVLDGVLHRAELQAGQRVLDIGCGTGTSTLRAAHQVGGDGHVTGVDISEPMLARARDLAAGVANVEFSTADAADYPFAAHSMDAAISRFGVMFFVDPVRAFANIRTSLKPGARMTMAAWGPLDANPWFQVPMYAAKRRLGAPPAVDPDAPGPLAFRDPERVLKILHAAGFSQSDVDVEDLHLTPPGDLAEVAKHASSIGPAARTMEHFEGSEADLAAIAEDVAGTFAQFQTPDGVRVPARINFFTATAP
jgi:SAM-dependent methyltransferase